MIRSNAIVIALLGWTALIATAAGDDLDDVRAVTIEHVATLNAGDAVGHIEHHLPQYSRFGSRGGGLDKSATLEQQVDELEAAFEAGLDFDVQITDLEVTIYGDAAIVTSYQVGTVKNPDRTTADVVNRRTAVLIKQDGVWKEAHTHISPLIVEISE